VNLDKEYLAAARRQVLLHGYQGTSLRKLAEILGIDVRAIYQDLGSKLDILGMLLEFEQSLWSGMQGQAEEETEDCRERILAWIELFHADQVQNLPVRGHLCVNLAGELGAVNDSYRQAQASIHDGAVRWVASQLQGVVRQNTQPSNREIAEFIVAGVVGSVLLSVVDQDEWELRNGLNRLRDFVRAL